MQENKQEISPIKVKILQVLDAKNVSQYTFYKNSGVTRGILSQTNGISEENIARFLAYFPDVSAEWLFRGVGEMIRHGNDGTTINITNTKQTGAGAQMGSITNNQHALPSNDEFYQQQIRLKDEQIAAKDNRIAELTDTIIKLATK